jgi:hypothetical protein
MRITIGQARAAKNVAKSELAEIPEVVGIGVTKVGDNYALKINLREEPNGSVQVPESIAGVPVKIEVVGRIRKHR